jgi:hypothetical protein
MAASIAISLLEMQQFDHLAVQADHAFAAVLGQRERRDDVPCMTELGLARGEHPVRRPDLSRVNQGLAVEPEHPALLALL